MLAAVNPGASSSDASTMLMVAKRGLNAPAPTKFQIIDPKTQALAEPAQNSINVLNVDQVDGEYVLLVAPATAGAQKGEAEEAEDDD
jgi:hypothetical protein